MELKLCLPCLVIISSCVFPDPASGSDSGFKERLEYLEHFVRGELYIVHKDIRADKADRRKIMKKLNETLETVIDKAVHVCNVSTSHLEELTAKFGQNSVAVKEVSETLFRYRRGFMEEKKARKSGIKELSTQIKVMKIKIVI